MEPTITLTLKPDGTIRLQANVDQPILLYGMLELGKDAVRSIKAQQAKGGIVAAPAEALNQLAPASK